MGYVDADYARDLDDRRSTAGYVFTLGGGLICWKSMVLSLVVLSTIELEYMAIAEVAKEALRLAGLVKELGIQQGGVQLHCDSQSVIFFAKELGVSCKDQTHRCEISQDQGVGLFWRVIA